MIQLSYDIAGATGDLDSLLDKFFFLPCFNQIQLCILVWGITFFLIFGSIASPIERNASVLSSKCILREIYSLENFGDGKFRQFVRNKWKKIDTDLWLRTNGG